MSGFWGALPPLLPAAYALLAPVLFLPTALVDAYILPRTALTVGFGFVLGGIGLASRVAGGGRRWSLLGWSGAAVVLAALIAAAFSINPLLSIAGAYTRYESVVVRLAYVGLFAGTVLLLSGAGGRRGRRLAGECLVAGATVAAAEAAWQLFTHSLARPDGNLGQANLLGVLLAMAISLAVQATFRRWLWAGTLPVLCLGLYATSSRASWIAAVVGCLVVLVAALPPRARRPGALLAGLAVAGALALMLVSPLRTLNNDTGSARAGVWRDGVSMALARPLAGWGEDSTGLVFGRFQTADWEPGDTFDRLHDEPLDLLVTQGLLGLLACGALWTAALLRCTAALGAGRGGAAALAVGAPLGAAAAYATWALLNFDWAPATGPAWLVLGLAVAEARPPARATNRSAAGAEPARAGPGRRTRLAAGGGAALLAAAGIVAALAPIAADHAYFAGEARRAVALDPIQAHYHRVLGDATASPAGRLAEFRRARDLGEYDYQLFIELGDAERDAGRPALARTAYRQARDLYRFDRTAEQRLRDLGGT